MEKFIAYEKLSKKEKRKLDSKKRKTWGTLNPVTRKPPNRKAYNRKKNQCRKDELHDTDFLCHFDVLPEKRKIIPPKVDDYIHARRIYFAFQHNSTKKKHRKEVPAALCLRVCGV